MSYTDADLARIRANPDITVVDSYHPREPVPAPYRDQAPTIRTQGFDATAITLPYPPSANVYWRMTTNRKTGRSMMVRSADANRYRHAVRQLCSAAGISPLEGDVVVSLHIFRPQRSGDLDNRIKVALDALQGYAYHNDDQVVEIHAYRHDDKDNPRVEVDVKRSRT